jgi:hypothetical protein
MQHYVYRPNAGGRFRPVLDDGGYPLAIHARVAGQSLFAGRDTLAVVIGLRPFRLDCSKSELREQTAKALMSNG